MWPSTSFHGYNKSRAPSAVSSSIDIYTLGQSLTSTCAGRKNTGIQYSTERTFALVFLLPSGCEPGRRVLFLFLTPFCFPKKENLILFGNLDGLYAQWNERQKDRDRQRDTQTQTDGWGRNAMWSCLNLELKMVKLGQRGQQSLLKDGEEAFGK